MNDLNCDCTLEDAEASNWSFIRYDRRGKAYFVICEHGNVILDERNDLEEYKDRSIKC